VVTRRKVQRAPTFCMQGNIAAMNIPKIFGATVENLVDRATTRPVFVHPWHMVLYVLHVPLQLHSAISYAPKNFQQVTPQVGIKMDADLHVK